MGLEDHLKETTVSCLPIVLGLALGGVGRLTDFPEIIAVPLVMDLIGGMPIHEPKSAALYFYGLFKYSLGASLFWVDKIDYTGLVNMVDNFY